jgi:hypothetical protein
MLLTPIIKLLTYSFTPMYFGSTGTTTNVTNTTATPTLTPEQQRMIGAQTDFFTGTIAPTYQNAVGGATNVYNNTAAGVQGAAQNYSQIAGQAQNVLGQTGESALRSGITGLQNVNSPEYVQQQLRAVLDPAQAQYQQNLAGQQARFGGAGQIGSQRDVMAQNQLAGQNQAIQQQGAAQVMNSLAAQQLQANQSLAGYGQQGMTGAQAAGANALSASMAPQELYNKYASVIFGTPAASYTPNFAGTQTQNQSGTTSGTQSQMGFNLGTLFGSDIRIKRDIKSVGKENGYNLYSFKYKDSDTTWVGVMAQEVMEIKPESVVTHKDGYYMVDYSKLGLTMRTLEEFQGEE